MARTYHILVADDDPMFRHVLSLLIQQWFPTAHIVLVPNGAEALAAHTVVPADVIITDYHMPCMNGLDLTRQLRTLQVFTPIMVCSCDDRVAERAWVAGANRFMVKTDVLSDLVPSLRALLPQDVWAP